MKFQPREEYFDSKNYLSYLYKKVKNKGLLNLFVNLNNKLRKVTVISKMLDIIIIVIGIIEKSATLLIIISVFFIIIPIAVLLLLVVSVVKIVFYLRWNCRLREWFDSAEEIHVYITSDKAIKKNSLALREAKEMASFAKNPIVIVTTDHFFIAKWQTFNLLAIKIDYYFALKTGIFGKNKQKMTYIVCS